MKYFSKKALPALGLGIVLSGQNFSLKANSRTLSDTLSINRQVSCDTLIAKFDELRSLKEFEKGEKVMLQALEHCPDNSIYWGKLSLNYFEAADNTYLKNKSVNKDNKLILFKKGLEAARICAQKDSLNKDAYEYMSMGYAGILSLSSYKQQAILADSVRIYAEKSIWVDPQNDRAYHILGRWHYEVANLNWLIKLFSELFIGVAPEGSYEIALSYFKKAVEINDYPIHNYWLGLNYLKMGNNTEAEKSFRKAIASKSGQQNDEFFWDLSRKILADKFD
jgi:tetratricopeptide (TPR) repeat protein